MRTLRLARVAVEAEGLRLRSMARRIATRVLIGLLAMVFLAGAFVFAHVALWYWLRLDYEWRQISTAAVLGGGDLVLAALLTLLATRTSPSRTEVEALEIRRRAWHGVASSMALSALLMPLLRLGVSVLRRRA
ncbi:MAG: hypothetical protein P4L71_13565 [Acetobacteraceae bacterium]|nr:hypothetical protein [Acetobacteraceae bacterium]